jgi:hypothetical protein
VMVGPGDLCSVCETWRFRTLRLRHVRLLDQRTPAPRGSPAC